jgi:putative hydrolase of the HAD superfamily
MTQADLTHVDVWLFDLDNTLYPEDSGFMVEHAGVMTDYVQKVTGLDREAAFALQKRYWIEHGLTLRGLMDDYGVDPNEFLALFHDASLDALAHDSDLCAAIAALPGRRYVFTNADDRHADRVLAHLNLDGLFHEVFHIHSFGFTPKPDPRCFEALVAAHGVDPCATAFFEDTERNLKPAHDLGMTTVLVGAQAAASTAPFVDHRTPTLTPFLATARLKDASR